MQRRIEQGFTFRTWAVRIGIPSGATFSDTFAACAVTRANFCTRRAPLEPNIPTIRIMTRRQERSHSSFDLRT